jgi:hypothetical protein
LLLLKIVSLDAPIFSAITFRAVDFPEPLPPYKIVTGSKSISVKSFLDNILKG